MEEEISIDPNSEIPPTHIFVYKEKQYPFNLDLFKIFSQYYTNSNIPKEKKIDIFDEDQNISEASIPDFINYCQAHKITLTKENSLTLYKLSQKFKVPSLLSKTKEFISKHQQDVVLEIMIAQNDDSFNLNEYEEILSNDLIKYINDDKLLSLSIPTLHRIITKYLQKIQSNSKNSGQPQELIEFLFKCLDHFGRNASVLFDQIDLYRSNGEFIHRLLDGYSEKFDFHFANSGILKSVYQLENEIITREKDMKHQMEQMRFEREEELESLRKQQEEELGKRDAVIAGLVEKFEAMQASYDEKLKKIGEHPKKMERPRTRRMFGNDRKGLISLLGDYVEISAGEENPSYRVSNLREYNDDFFTNTCCPCPPQSTAIIEFNFGPSNRVDLRSYFIRAWADIFPKSWRIEGSNDRKSWAKLDSRSGDSSLDGKYKEGHFICQQSQYGSEDNLFRYIRYVQEDSWTSDSHDKYRIYITYFELYGDVVMI